MQQRTGAKPAPVVVAADQVAAAIESVAEAVQDVRRLVADRIPSAPPINASPARRARAAWLLTIPGAANEFKRVPADHLEDDGGTVRCVCESRTSLRCGELDDCPGGCGRVFLRSDVSMWVARWEPAELEDRYAGEGWTPAEAA